MFNELKYLEIHRDLAERNVLLKHDKDVNVAWIGPDDGEDALFAKTKAPFVMAMLPPTGRMVGDTDGVRPLVNGGFELMGKVVPGAQKDYRNVEQICSQAMDIGMQCVARLAAMADGELCDTGECKCVLGAFNPSLVTFERIVGGNGWYGYRFVYPLGSTELLEYLPEMWL